MIAIGNTAYLAINIIIALINSISVVKSIYVCNDASIAVPIFMSLVVTIAIENNTFLTTTAIKNTMYTGSIWIVFMICVIYSFQIIFICEFAFTILDQVIIVYITPVTGDTS